MTRHYPYLFNSLFQSGLDELAFNPFTLIFPLLLAFVFALILAKNVQRHALTGFIKNRWFFILTLLLIPFVFANVHPFDGEVLGFTGKHYAPLMPLLIAMPIILAVGTVGPVASLIIGLLAGLTQYFVLKQDLSVLLFYPSVGLIFSVLLNETPEDTSHWRTNLSKLFETAMLTLPFWMVYQFNLAFVHELRDVIAVLTHSIFLWINHLPELIITGLALYFLTRYLPSEWKPKSFLKESGHTTVFTSAAEQISHLSKGNYDQPIESNPRTIGEKVIFDSLESLRKSLQVRTDTQSRLLSLDPSHYSREGYDLVMSSILRAALTHDASAARLILLDTANSISKPEMRLRLGQGENTRNYAYLDPMILEKIADQDQLVLSDIKVDQYFGLTPGTPYPKSIVALQLKGNENSRGVLWVGFEQSRWFSDEEIDFYKELAFRATASLNTKEQISKIKTEKTWLNEVLNAIPDPLIVINDKAELIFQNLASQGVDSGSEFFETGESGKRFSQKALVELMQKSKSSLDKEKTIKLSNNKEYTVEIYPVKLEGKQTGTIVYLKDNQWILQATKEKNEFVSNISHDLRSPLKLMGGYTRLIKHIGNLSDQQVILVNRLETGIEDMRRLVSKVLELERLDTKLGLMYTTFDIKEMIVETIDMLEIQAQQKKISVNTDFGLIKAPYISADRVLLQQAIYNLIENAIKFSPRGETVLIKAEKDASWMHLTVQDHGKGIAPLDQSRIFNRFFHMDDEHNFENRGQGLGLSIVKSIAEKHGGSVNVESKLGTGSIFYLDIPIHSLDGMKKLDKS